METLRTRAPAKINLTLRIIGRRTDGFHDLASLVVFSGAADLLSLTPDAALSLTVKGRTAAAAGPDADNLVLRAARAFSAEVPGAQLGAFLLEKRLPVAAGLGGGSSDAAAALRLLGRLNGLAPDDPRLFAAARATGSDVPVCLDPRARLMEGVGDVLSPPLALPPLAGVLVNCGVAVPTAAVFRQLGLAPGGAFDGPSLPAVLPSGRAKLVAAIAAVPNDLEPPAVAVAPKIAEVIDRLAAQPEARLVRMSGSGATVFALTDDCRAAAALARRVLAAEPDWWVKPTILR
ncbi:4-diphosphocytidyl-2-C-methyl-D-erythritol kinase [Xanthobacter flavus]|uniref:4-diphosphocytidyl-2-C-methyl-D-erythritol kinase n=1 Tax=Xanthobacter flavus TaxID=281 RepID=A0A9W6CMY2_XANFL|nr:4-(cytidine 5'-diphospho)-2-C-methyl-D-erythritol kinase [Xanthobacter flavus]MDR6336389.1 4-diphosphocytidyl-2-C-methyl-D-erythritol kinase [Xanthobacter flavus]GLI25363.1 4-diphosphocytidyl-2-C-methyl-D-erythritol kinase [Xanthobacter flavus]